MKVLITGATGLIGQHIVRLCHQASFDVNYLTTSKEKLSDSSNYRGFFWDPKNGDIDVACFEDVEVIFHLAGATVAKRWTSSYKKEIIESRTVSTNLLLASIKEIKHSVRHIVSASAIGIYPDSFQNYYVEDAPQRDTGFLGQVVTRWEEAVNQFEALDIKVSLLRIGLVLSKQGGAFPKIAGPIKYGLGAFFGNGKQWQSWIHINDLAQMFMFVMNEELTGVFNAVAPNPVSNKKLTCTIAHKMNKKIVLPGIPRLMLKLFLGDMHTLLYASQRVGSSRISSAGFEFEYDNIESAVEDLV